MGLKGICSFKTITYLIIICITSSFTSFFLLHYCDLMTNTPDSDFEPQRLKSSHPHDRNVKSIDVAADAKTSKEDRIIITDGNTKDSENTAGGEEDGSNGSHKDVDANAPPPKQNVMDVVKTAFDRLIVDPVDNRDAPGEMSKGYSFKPSNLTEDVQWYEDGWKNHGFNQYASDHISLQRTLRENRHPLCLEEKYDSMNYLDTSVVIIFYNEALSPLLRTVYSVINHSPPHLLKEVFMVDDHSSNYELQEPLQEFVKNHFPEKVKLLRTPARVGLMNARLYGTNASTAKTVTFLDSHCECTDGWLEPLLQRVSANRTTVTMPVINVISSEDFTFKTADGTNPALGGFEWSLHFTWLRTPAREFKRKESLIDPFWSPTMAGCIFTIDKTFFKELGFYDPEYKLYGAENLEISFKIWMCGGRLELIPCSHVGHMFRPVTPYLTANNSLSFTSEMKNKMRLAEVWMDGYKHYFYEIYDYKKLDYGDITERKALRQNLKCHSFEWYLKNIYPEHYLPEDHLAGGRLRNHKTGQCVDATFPGLHSQNQTYSPKMTKCAHKIQSQIFMLGTEDARIRCDCLCMMANSEERVQLVPCSSQTANHRWKYEHDNGRILHEGTSKCLDISEERSYRLVLNTCSISATTQHWRWYSKEQRSVK